MSRIMFTPGLGSNGTFSRWNDYVDSVEGLLGHSLTQRQFDQANEAFLDGESAVEFALTIHESCRSTSLDQEPPQPPVA